MEHVINALTVIFSLAAAIAAYQAMQKGLTYAAMSAACIVLVLIGISNLMHLLSLFSALTWLEDYHFDHWVNILGYVTFIFLVAKSRKLKTA